MKDTIARALDFLMKEEVVEEKEIIVETETEVEEEQEQKTDDTLQEEAQSEDNEEEVEAEVADDTEKKEDKEVEVKEEIVENDKEEFDADKKELEVLRFCKSKGVTDPEMVDALLELSIEYKELPIERIIGLAEKLSGGTSKEGTDERGKTLETKTTKKNKGYRVINPI